MNLVISPHTDDAIFSIGEFLTTMEDVVILSPMAGIPDDDIGKAKHTTLRIEHDEACRLIGAKVRNGGFLDDVYPERTPTEDVLEAWFDAEYALFKPKNIYIPLGIHHPDHVMVARVALRCAPSYSSIYMYEELPYRVLYPVKKDNALGSISSSIIGLVSLDVRIPTATKKSLVEVYQSQTDDLLVGKLMHEERIWKILI